MDLFIPYSPERKLCYNKTIPNLNVFEIISLLIPVYQELLVVFMF